MRGPRVGAQLSSAQGGQREANSKQHVAWKLGQPRRRGDHDRKEVIQEIQTLDVSEVTTERMLAPLSVSSALMSNFVSPTLSLNHKIFLAVHLNIVG